MSLDSAEQCRAAVAECQRLRVEVARLYESEATWVAFAKGQDAEIDRLTTQRDALVQAARTYLAAHDTHWETDAEDDETEADLYEAEDHAMTALRAAVASCTDAG